MHAYEIFDDLQKHFLSEKKDNSSPSSLRHLPYLKQICVDPGGSVKKNKKKQVHAIKGGFGTGFHYVSLIKMHRRDVV